MIKYLFLMSFIHVLIYLMQVWKGPFGTKDTPTMLRINIWKQAKGLFRVQPQSQPLYRELNKKK